MRHFNDVKGFQGYDLSSRPFVPICSQAEFATLASISRMIGEMQCIVVMVLTH